MFHWDDSTFSRENFETKNNAAHVKVPYAGKWILYITSDTTWIRKCDPDSPCCKACANCASDSKLMESACNAFLNTIKSIWFCLCNGNFWPPRDWGHMTRLDNVFAEKMFSGQKTHFLLLFKQKTQRENLKTDCFHVLKFLLIVSIVI